jgi:hypothetical protein
LTAEDQALHQRELLHSGQERARHLLGLSEGHGHPEPQEAFRGRGADDLKAFAKMSKRKTECSELSLLARIVCYPRLIVTVSWAIAD